MSENKEFPQGLIVKAPRQGAPDFVKMSISIKRKDLGNWLRGKDDDWINIDVKESRGGKLYAEVNNWKPDQSQHQQDKANGYHQDKKDDEFFNDDVPW